VIDELLHYGYELIVERRTDPLQMLPDRCLHEALRVRIAEDNFRDQPEDEGNCLEAISLSEADIIGYAVSESSMPEKHTSKLFVTPGVTESGR